MPLVCLVGPGQRHYTEAGGPPPGDDDFFDDFASGDMTKSMNGFNWGGGVIPCGEIISGFGVYGDTGFCIENRLDFGTNALIGLTLPGVQELWLLWVIYMPDGTESPTRGPKMEDGSINGNKLLRVTAIATEGSSPYPRFGASMYPGTGTDVNLGPQAGIFPGTGTVSQIGTEVSWCNDANRGRRVVMEWHGKNSTSDVTPNGEQRFWIDGALVSEETGLNTYEVGNPGFENAYFFGSVDGEWATDPGTLVYLMYVAGNTTGRCTNPLA